jgi:hypothetical protein
VGTGEYDHVCTEAVALDEARADLVGDIEVVDRFVAQRGFGQRGESF